MPNDEPLYRCTKCGKMLRSSSFYNSNNLEKYPTGKLNICKKCITMHVDNWNSDTYLWILQEADVPYLPTEWNTLMARYVRDGSKINGATILGRYLGKMKLNQWNRFRWKDSKFLQELEDNKIAEAMRLQGFSEGEIAQTLEEGKTEIIEEAKIPKIEVPDNAQEVYNQLKPQMPPRPLEPAVPAAGFTDLEPQITGRPVDVDMGLTDEEKTYLSIKWGDAYNQPEWVKLEQLYEEMMQSYDIQSAGHKDTLKLICKTSLKANQLIDCGD